MQLFTDQTGRNLYALPNSLLTIDLVARCLGNANLFLPVQPPWSDALNLL